MTCSRRLEWENRELQTWMRTGVRSKFSFSRPGRKYRPPDRILRAVHLHRIPIGRPRLLRLPLISHKAGPEELGGKCRCKKLPAAACAQLLSALIF